MQRNRHSIFAGWLAVAACAVAIACATNACAGDWSRFRGDNGTGVSNEAGVPVTWSDSENVKWKTELPGRGAYRRQRQRDRFPCRLDRAGVFENQYARSP